MSYQYLAEKMVQEELLARGIRDQRVLQAFLRVPRHLFIEEALRDRAYGGHSLPIGRGQTLSQPYIQAHSLELLRIEPGAKVLEVGTGSGYQTALLAELTDRVYSIEQYRDLYQVARQRLVELGYAQIVTHCGDGSLGLPQVAPFDAIVVAAVGSSIPLELYEQLAPQGRMVVPVWQGEEQHLMLVMRGKERPLVLDKGRCDFVPLVGKHRSLQEKSDL